MIIIPTKYPILQVLKKLDISEFLTKWAIELSEFDVRFTLAKAIKDKH